MALGRIGLLLISLIVLSACQGGKGETKADGDTSPSGEKKTEEEKAIPVRIKKMAMETVIRRIETSGSFEADRDVTLLSETSGRVVSDRMELGKAVAENEILVQVDPEPYRIALETAQAGRDQSKAAEESARLVHERNEKLYKTKDISEAQFDQTRLALAQTNAALRVAEAAVDSAKRALRLSSVKAPFKGEIAARLVKLGDMLAPGTPVAQVVDRDSLKIVAGVGEDDIGLVEPGLSAKVTIPTLQKDPLPAKVVRVGIKALKPSMTYPIELRLTEAHPRVRAGMVARISIEFGEATQALVLPMEVLTERFDRYYLYVVDGERVTERRVELERAVGRDVVLKSGVEPGESIVVTGQANLKDQSRIQVVE